jgi:glucokinase
MSSRRQSVSTAIAQLAIGIDMGGSSVKLGVCRGAELLYQADPIPTHNFRGAKDLLAAMRDAILGLQQTTPGIVAVGMGVPGFTDVNSGMVHALTNVPSWENVPLNTLLSKATGIPTFVENDANCMAYAEFKHGAGVGATNMIGVTLGTGVGGGLVLNGQLYRGTFCGAGEIGQMSIDYRGKLGTYGNIGANEEYLGNRELAAQAAELFEAAGRKMTLDESSPAALSAAAKKGDKVALQVWDDFTTQLSCGLANCIWLLNPDTIVIGGGISNAGSQLLVPLRKKLKAQLHKTFKHRLRVVRARFGNGAGIIGSAAVALERFKSISY